MTPPTTARQPLARAPKEGWWEDALALPPRKAVVYERADKPRADGLPPLTVRQWSPERGNWQKAALEAPKTLYDLRGKRLTGRELTTAKQEARAAAMQQLQAWAVERAGATSPDPAAAVRPLTVAETEAVITALGTGKYPKDSPWRREVLRSLAFAGDVWGAATPWNAIGKAKLRELGRRRVDDVRARGGRGLRPAEITVGAVLAVAAWLRDENHIDEKAALPSSKWKQDLKEYWSAAADGRPYVVNRPRHSVDESRRILAAADQVDPRLHLLLAVGAELRAGQVERARRTDVLVDPDGMPRRVVIHTRGKKRGTPVLLTDGQAATLRLALEAGYLRDLEAAFRAGSIEDYPLFPSGQLRGGRKGADPVALVTSRRRTRAKAGVPGAFAPPAPRTTRLSKTTLLRWFHVAEARAEVEPVPGRAFYGIRRQAVDDGLRQRISKHGMKALGGWADTQIPDTIYANQESDEHLAEARDARAKFRGETPRVAVDPAAATPTDGPTEEA